MCKSLNIARSTYYYESVTKKDTTDLEIKIKQIFHNNHDVYGARKIKKELQMQNYKVSRRRIGRIMKKLGLVSKYTIANLNHIEKSAMKNQLKMN